MSLGTIVIQRYFCIPCKTTHSVLKPNLLPICRWFLTDILAIIARFKNGESAYAISKSIGESLKSVQNLKTWYPNAGIAIETVTRESDPREPLPPRPISRDSISRFKFAYRWASWKDFTHSFSRYFYPKRFRFWRSHTNRTG